ncbi:MAG: hypothetical protein AB1611_21300 [bacterium]
MNRSIVSPPIRGNAINSFNDWEPSINAQGYAVWRGYDGSDCEIYLYNGTGTIQLTNNSFDDEQPRINAQGYVVWYGHDGHDNEIFLYNGSRTIQLTDNSSDDLTPNINNNGYVVWQSSSGTDREIFLAGRVQSMSVPISSQPVLIFLLAAEIIGVMVGIRRKCRGNESAGID